MSSGWFCYLLESADARHTYVGATIDPDRRLRQHNGELVGGASATRGKSWHRVCLVEGFPTEAAALQFEWRWKNATKQFRHVKGSLARRRKALEFILSLEKTTAKAIPYSEWPFPPIIHWEDIDGDNGSG